jgi:pyrroloquinoline quinone biosynthesis protein D
MYRLQWEEAQKAHVLLFPEGMVKLNASAGEILRRCDGIRTTGEIIAELEAAFGTKNLAPDVDAFLEHAVSRGWVEA